VFWIPPSNGVIKINYDGSSIRSQPCGSVGFVFRDSSSNFLSAMVSNIGHASPLEAEFSTFMLAIGKAKAMHLTNIWLETDSVAVVNAFHKMLVFHDKCLTNGLIVGSFVSRLLADALTHLGKAT